MTIYKPKPGDKKVEKKSDSKIRIPEDVTPLATKKKADAPVSFVLVPEARRRRRRGVVVAFTTCCLIVLVTIVAVSGVCLFRYIMHKKGLCTKKAEFHYYEFQKVRSHGLSTQRRVDGTFIEDIELDMETGAFERISVPPILEARRSTVLHDFETNWTAIADHDYQRCFVMPLNRKAVSPPTSFADLLDKYDAGYYLPDAELVRENYHVKLPAVHDLSQFGIYIAYDCRFYATYELVRDDDFIREKRSACEMAGDLYCLGDAGPALIPCVKLSGCL